MYTVHNVIYIISCNHNYTFYVILLAIPHNSYNNLASSDAFTCV